MVKNDQSIKDIGDSSRQKRMSEKNQANIKIIMKAITTNNHELAQLAFQTKYHDSINGTNLTEDLIMKNSDVPELMK